MIWKRLKTEPKLESLGLEPKLESLGSFRLDFNKIIWKRLKTELKFESLGSFRAIKGGSIIRFKGSKVVLNQFISWSPHSMPDRHIKLRFFRLWFSLQDRFLSFIAIKAISIKLPNAKFVHIESKVAKFHPRLVLFDFQMITILRRKTQRLPIRNSDKHLPEAYCKMKSYSENCNTVYIIRMLFSIVFFWFIH